MRRIALVSGIAATALVVGSTASLAVAATAPPKVTAVSPSSGPLSARQAVLVGQHLRQVTAVRFGSVPAGRLVHTGDSRLTVLAPASRRAGRVTVSVYSARKWRTVSSYTYVARPVVTGLSSRSGPVSGGSTLRVAGHDLAASPSVRIGGAAATITRRSATALDVTVPAGVLGSAAVSVTTVGGTSPAASAATYSYVLPAAADTASYDPAASTVTATGVQWVTHDDTDPFAPWIVSVQQGSTLPSVGDGYFLAPGGDAYPAGFAGTVSTLASQQDGSTRITVQASALGDTLDDYSVDYAPGGGDTGGMAPHARTTPSAAAASTDPSFTGLHAGAFECKHGSDGELATFSGEIGLKFSGLTPVFETHGGLHPSFNAYVTGSVTAYGKLSVDGSMTCTLRQSWADANKKIIPIGTTGATLSIAPHAVVTISGQATASVEQTTKFTYGVKKTGDSAAQFYQKAEQESPKASASVTVTVDAAAGPAVQIGWLDRVGVDIGADLAVHATLTYDASKVQVCAAATFSIELSITGFLDLFVERWETGTAKKSIPFARLTGCTGRDTSVLADGDPQITSDTLPDATYGQAYSTELTTSDNRNGSWSLNGGSLPPGLSLSGPDIAGTPTAVGTYRVGIRFVDALDRSDYATLLVTVDPAQGLGGGDIQATLTWDGPADLDLHGVEPGGDEIYYGQPGPTDTGGELDHDANAGCNSVDPSPAENIFWPSDQAAGGAYTFSVVTYSECDSDELSWHLVVRVRGAVVIDQSGYGDSDSYVLNYSADGRASVRTERAVPHAHAAKTVPHRADGSPAARAGGR